MFERQYIAPKQVYYIPDVTGYNIIPVFHAIQLGGYILSIGKQVYYYIPDFARLAARQVAKSHKFELKLGIRLPPN